MGSSMSSSCEKERSEKDEREASLRYIRNFKFPAFVTENERKGLVDFIESYTEQLLKSGVVEEDTVFMHKMNFFKRLEVRYKLRKEHQDKFCHVLADITQIKTGRPTKTPLVCTCPKCGHQF